MVVGSAVFRKLFFKGVGGKGRTDSSNVCEGFHKGKIKARKAVASTTKCIPVGAQYKTSRLLCTLAAARCMH